MEDGISSPCRPRLAVWELALLALAVACSLILGFANLSAPSYWHDELAHVYVAKGIVETGKPVLPSGARQGGGVGYSMFLAPVLAAFGDGEFAMRAPSVVVTALNVILTYGLLRVLLGRPAALAAAFALALSPWNVAWARQARLYPLQQTAYLAFLWAGWLVAAGKSRGAVLAGAVIACLAYAASLTLSFLSVVFLASMGAFAFLMLMREPKRNSRWVKICYGICALGLATLLWNKLAMTQQDYDTTVTRAQLGLNRLTDVGRQERLFYVFWLRRNLSSGYFILAMAGFVWMRFKEKERGMYAAWAFWAPVLILTWFIGYRRPRFMFFAYPIYIAAFSYALVQLAALVPRFRRSWLHAIAAAFVALFAVRLGWSTVNLVADSLETASGANLTLARRIPQWREPCRYVRERRGNAAVLTTTYLPVLHYVGHVDDWYPSDHLWWEYVESGSRGIKTVEELEAFVVEHPRGYFLAEHQRFGRWTKAMADDIAWVKTNMTRLDAVSSEDVVVYAWGLDTDE